MRSHDLFGKVLPEEIASLPTVQIERNISVTPDSSVHVFELSPLRTRQRDSSLLINFHGGGFIKGRQDKDQVYCSHLVEKIGCLIWDVDYSLAPEAPFPTAVHEAYAIALYAYENAAELDIDPARIILLGHSAGGNLVASVCIRLAETKAFQPAGALMEYFPADLHTDPAIKPHIENDLAAENARLYNSFYCPPEKTSSPFVSPLFASEQQLTAFPDTLILTAGYDSLRSEDEEFAMKLARAGVAVTIKRFCRSSHGFTINRNGEWADGINLHYSFIAQHLAELSRKCSAPKS